MSKIVMPYKKRPMEMFVDCPRKKTRDLLDHNMKVGLCAKPGNNRSISMEEKRKFRSQLLQVSSKKMENLRTVFCKFGWKSFNKERVDMYMDSTDDQTLWKLRREIKVLLDAKDTHKKEKRRNQNGFAYANGRQSFLLNEEKSPNHLSTPATAVESFNVEMSPKKALRVAMLKSRFADTILKATHQMTLVRPNGQKSDPQRRQKEMERLEREQLKQKAKIAAEMRSLSSREQIERRRAAARIELQKVERSVEIDENKDTLKELEMLSFGSSPRMLEQFGLYIKDDYNCDLEEDYDEDSLLDVEEGEITF